MTITVWRVCLAGAGNVGGSLLDMIASRGPDLADRYGVRLHVTGVAELGGAAVDVTGLDLGLLLATLRAGRSLAELSTVGRPAMTPAQMLAESRADILLEATPVNLRDGEPGLGTVRAALDLGMHVVMANKGPLALAYAELVGRADPGDWWLPRRGPRTTGSRPRLRFSATVAGALPVVNLGHRDLAGCRITRIEGVFNGTSHSILRAMEAGHDFPAALADAQSRGIAEADPSLDVDGHDAACKLVIAANAILGRAYTLADVAVEGIRGLKVETIMAARDAGATMLLLCTAEPGADGEYRLSVKPSAVPLDHPLARLHPDEMGVVFTTDWVDRLAAASLEPGPQPAAAAMLRDVLDIARVARPTG